MRAPAVLVASALAVCAAAADVPVIRFEAGAAYRYDRQTRTALGDPGEIGWRDEYGYHLALGMSAPEPGLLGQPWLDFDWARSKTAEGRIDTVGVLYLERIPYDAPVWIGLGPGTYYSDVRIGDRSRTGWRIGGRATFGFDLVGPLFVEAGYSYSGRVMGIKTDSFDLSFGVAF